MKLLSDYLSLIGSTVLVNMPAYKSGESYNIDPTKLDTIINYINNGLTQLYTDLILLKKNYLIKFELPHTNYPIRPEYAITSDSNEPHKFIQDSIFNPFYGNFIRLMDVIDEQYIRLPINDYNSLSSVFTPEYDVIQFSGLNIGTYFDIHYQANHIPITNNNYTTQNIVLPPFLFDLLTKHIMYQYKSDMLGNENIAQAQNYLLLYNNGIVEVKNKGLIPEYNTDYNLRFEYNGFV